MMENNVTWIFFTPPLRSRATSTTRGTSLPMEHAEPTSVSRNDTWMFSDQHQVQKRKSPCFSENKSILKARKTDVKRCNQNDSNHDGSQKESFLEKHAESNLDVSSTTDMSYAREDCLEDLRISDNLSDDDNSLVISSTLEDMSVPSTNTDYTTSSTAGTKYKPEQGPAAPLAPNYGPPPVTPPYMSPPINQMANSSMSHPSPVISRHNVGGAVVALHPSIVDIIPPVVLPSNPPASQLYSSMEHLQAANAYSTICNPITGITQNQCTDDLGGTINRLLPLCQVERVYNAGSANHGEVPECQLKMPYCTSTPTSDVVISRQLCPKSTTNFISSPSMATNTDCSTTPSLSAPGGHVRTPHPVAVAKKAMPPPRSCSALGQQLQMSHIKILQRQSQNISLNSSGEDDRNSPDYPHTSTVINDSSQPIKPESVKRCDHNLKEKERRMKIRLACDELRGIVPGLSRKTDKATTFEYSVHYIKYMQNLLRELDVKFDKDFLQKCDSLRS